jgi:excisionase family DNA binding protein
MNELLTTTEAASTLRISRATLYSLIRSGRLAGCRIGSQWRVRRSDLDKAVTPIDPPFSAVVTTAPAPLSDSVSHPIASVPLVPVQRRPLPPELDGWIVEQAR